MTGALLFTQEVSDGVFGIGPIVFVHWSDMALVHP